MVRLKRLTKEKNKFTHVAYIKPINGNNSDSVTVTGVLTQGSNEYGTQPNVKIYEYVGTEKVYHKVFMQIQRIAHN